MKTIFHPQHQLPLNRKKRSSFNQTNANLFKPWYDRVINTNLEMLLPWEFSPQNKSSTLYVKANDGLKWLCENGSAEDKLKYILLRSNYKINIETKGLVLRHKNKPEVDITKLLQHAEDKELEVIKNTEVESFMTNTKGILNDEKQAEFTNIPINEKISPSQVADSWQNLLMKFINESKTSERFDTEFKTLTDVDKEWIANAVGEGIVEYIFLGNKLKMVRL